MIAKHVPSLVRSPKSARWFLWLTLIVMALALPLIGHGCHRGDHGDADLSFGK